MEFRLYKEPYQEPFFPEKVRLLFESVASIDDGIGGNSLYLYVWIDNGTALSAFQAVWDEEYVLDFHTPNKLEFSRISSKPIKRSMSKSIDEIEKGKFLFLFSKLKSKEFPALLSTVEAIAHSENVLVEDCAVSKADRDVLTGLIERTRESKGNTHGIR